MRPRGADEDPRATLYVKRFRARQADAHRTVAPDPVLASANGNTVTPSMVVMALSRPEPARSWPAAWDAWLDVNGAHHAEVLVIESVAVEDTGDCRCGDERDSGSTSARRASVPRAALNPAEASHATATNSGEARRGVGQGQQLCGVDRLDQGAPAGFADGDVARQQQTDLRIGRQRPMRQQRVAGAEDDVVLDVDAQLRSQGASRRIERGARRPYAL